MTRHDLGENERFDNGRGPDCGEVALVGLRVVALAACLGAAASVVREH